MFSLKETLLLSAAVGFLVIWVSEVFKGIPFKESYIWVMFSIGCLLAFQYVKNQRLRAEDDKQKTPSTNLSKHKSTKKKK